MAVAGAAKFVMTPKPSGASAAQAGGGGGGPGAGGRGGRGAAQISVATVQSREFVDSIEVLGVAKGRQSVTITAAATQLVQRVLFRAGQSVAQGQVLVELKNTEQDAAIAQTQARLVQAQRAYDRWKALAEKGYASQSAVDQYQAAYISAQADLEAAKSRQGDRRIRAPFAGVVGLSDVAPGALVNPGAPIVTLDDLSGVRVDFQVPERLLSQVAQGQTISAAVDAFPGEQISGRVALLDTRVDERTRAVTARADFPNAEGRLKPGMMVRVSIPRARRQALAAPETAVAVQGDSAFVYVIKSQAGKMSAEQRPVVTGLRQDSYVEILDGVQAGEKIVLDGLNKLQPGQPVRIAGPGKPRPGEGGAPGAPGASPSPAGAPGSGPTRP